MEQLLRRRIGDRIAVGVATECIDGDVHPERVDAALLRRRQVEATGATWVMIDEVHGTDVVEVDAQSPWPLAGSGDVLLARHRGVMLAVWAADCAQIALFGADGTSCVAVHAGWRGLAGGILDSAVDALESTGTTVSAAVLGPCIHSCCYEFGAGDLDRVAAGVGALPTDLTGLTAWGAMALDVPRAVAVGLARRGVALDAVGSCTGCDRRFRSHRRRAEVERHALVAWFEAAS